VRTTAIVSKRAFINWSHWGLYVFVETQSGRKRGNGKENSLAV
jgi:hypothetical protein